VAQAAVALEAAVQRRNEARRRARTGLLRSAWAHDRAAERHEQSAPESGSQRTEHRNRAAAHRAAAAADRLRADEMVVEGPVDTRFPGEPATEGRGLVVLPGEPPPGP
jgi:hypothetical protein